MDNNGPGANYYGGWFERVCGERGVKIRWQMKVDICDGGGNHQTISIYTMRT